MGKNHRVVSFLLQEVSAELRNTSKIYRDWSPRVKKRDPHVRWAPPVVEKERHLSRWAQPPFLAQSENLATDDIVSQDRETAMRTMKKVITVHIDSVVAGWTFCPLRI